MERAEAAEAKNKELEQDNLMKEQEIASLQHKLSVVEADLENAENKLSEAQVGKEEGESHKSNVDILQRRIYMLEEQLDSTDKNLRETTEQCV